MGLTPKEKIIRAKVQLQSKKPFFSMLVMHMRIREDKSCPSMGVNFKGDMWYNPDWVSSLSEAEVEGVLVHEVMHVVLNHLDRLGEREAQLFNIANDLVVNDMLVTDGMKLPSSGLIPSRHNYTFEEDNFTITGINKKMSESIYHELWEHYKKNKKPNSSSDGFDEHKYGTGEGESNGGKSDGNTKKVTAQEIAEIKDKWKGVLAQASTYAKQRGMLPAGMERLVEDLLDTKVSWRHKLYKFITNELPYDFTYSRPSKKSISTGVYMPSIVKEKIEMVVAIDTSGSIGQKELTEFLTEVVSIAKSFNNLEMHLIECDAQVHQALEIRNGNIQKILEMKPKGGGGTSHKPVVEWCKENKPNCRLLIALTDGYSDIESCFDDLHAHKVIVLTENSCDESQLEDYGEIVKLEV